MAKRLLELEPTGLFGDEAILTSLSGREEISRPFDFTLTIASPKDNIEPDQVIGQPISVRINRDDEEPRYIHGYISTLWAGNMVSADSGLQVFRMYRVRVVPWMWFMMRAARCFVYLPEKLEKTIQDVLDEVIKRVKSYGHINPDLDSKSAKILSTRSVEHCVQYRESDFRFFSRILEQYGIYYYFKFAAGKHTLVMSDQLNYPDAVEKEVSFMHSNETRYRENRITAWEHGYEFVTGKWEHTDYDFIHPSTNLKATASKHDSIKLKNNKSYEFYDYPGEYVKRNDGQSEAVVRLEEEEARFNTVSGVSNCKTFSPGYCFKLVDHPNVPSEKGKSYLITSVTHMATQPGPFTSDAEEAVYTNSFTCVPKDVQYRPERRTEVPVLSSIQTAVVVGPPGEEIYTDEYGRVKVQFHWDREGKRDENTSCWVRVVQVHAGKGFGGIDIPRVGEEVVVSFLEGDPDRPLITGRVYHKESMPPFSLPGEKTRSGIKTKTYKGSGYNELSMDDTPGKEQIRIHGQYNMDTVIENDETHTIHNNRTKNVDVDETMTIGNNQQLSVGVNKTVKVGTNHNETVGSNQTVSVGANQSTTVGSNQSNTVGIMKNEMVGLMSNEMVGVAKSSTVGVAYALTSAILKNEAVGIASLEEVGIYRSLMVGQDYSVDVGNDISMSAGSNLSITAGSLIEIKCGKSKITMDAAGNMTFDAPEQCVINGGGAKIVMKGGIIDLN